MFGDATRPVKTKRHLLLFAAVITMAGCVAPKRTTLPPHPFRLVGVEPKQAQGVFTFTNTTGKPLHVFGFDSPDDGEFQIRFTEYQFQTPKGWQDLKITYCGTGAQNFVLQPGRTYTIREGLSSYTGDQAGGATVGRILLPTLRSHPKIWSEPFNIPRLQ